MKIPFSSKAPLFILGISWKEQRFSSVLFSKNFDSDSIIDMWRSSTVANDYFMFETFCMSSDQTTCLIPRATNSIMVVF